MLDLSADITLDGTPPVTTSDAPTGWKAASVTVHLSPNDTGSGVASTEYSTDGGSTWLPGTSLTVVADRVAHVTDGPTTVWYRSADHAGNTEATRTCTVRLDTKAPTTRARSRAAARRGRTATLKYRVNDLGPNGGAATVTIKLKNHTGKIVKTLRCGAKTVNMALSARFKVPGAWKVGAYRFFVYAIDQAGNVQSKVGHNRLTVR